MPYELPEMPHSNIVSSNQLEQRLGDFSDEQLRLIMSNIGGIQLTEGCSTGCYDCGLGAEPKVSDYIPPKTLKWITETFSEELCSGLRLTHHASEPFDYNFEGWTYEDVHRLIETKIRFSPSSTTSVPKGTELYIMEKVLNGNNLGVLDDPYSRYIGRISLTKVNKKRIYNAIETLVPMLQDQITIPVNYEFMEFREVYYKTKEDNFSTEGKSDKILKRVLTDEEKVFSTLGIDDPKKFFLNGFGRGILSSSPRIKHDENSSYALWIMKHHPDKKLTDEKRKKIWAEFRRIENINKKNHIYKHYLYEKDQLESVLHCVQMPNGDVVAIDSRPVTIDDIFDYLRFCRTKYMQSEKTMSSGIAIENYIKYNQENEMIHMLRLGPQYSDNLSEKGIGCYNGVLMTPKGVFNLKTVKPSIEHPYGQILTPIKPEDFKIRKLFFSWNEDNLYNEDLNEELTL